MSVLEDTEPQIRLGYLFTCLDLFIFIDYLKGWDTEEETDGRRHLLHPLLLSSDACKSQG